MFVWFFMCRSRYLCMYLAAGAVGGGGAGWGSARGAQAPSPGPLRLCRPRSPLRGQQVPLPVAAASPVGLGVFAKRTKRGCLPGCKTGLQALIKPSFNMLAKMSVFFRILSVFFNCHSSGVNCQTAKGLSQAKGCEISGQSEAQPKKRKY